MIRDCTLARRDRFRQLGKFSRRKKNTHRHVTSINLHVSRADQSPHLMLAILLNGFEWEQKFLKVKRFGLVCWLCWFCVRFCNDRGLSSRFYLEWYWTCVLLTCKYCCICCGALRSMLQHSRDTGRDFLDSLNCQTDMSNGLDRAAIVQHQIKQEISKLDIWSTQNGVCQFSKKSIVELSIANGLFSQKFARLVYRNFQMCC